MPSAVKKQKEKKISNISFWLSHKTGGKKPSSGLFRLAGSSERTQSQSVPERSYFKFYYFFMPLVSSTFFLMSLWQAHYTAAGELYCRQTIITRVKVWLPCLETDW